jgi:hypothetical protein
MRERGTATARVPRAGTSRAPEKVEALRSKFSTEQPPGATTLAMLRESTVIGTWRELVMSYQRKLWVPGYSKTGIWLVDELLRELEIVKLVPGSRVGDGEPSPVAE